MGTSFWISITSDVSTQFFFCFFFFPPPAHLVTTCPGAYAVVKVDRMGLRSQYTQDEMVLRD